MFDTFQSRHFTFMVYVSGFFFYLLIPPIRNAEHTQYFLILHTVHALCGIFLLRSFSESPSPRVLTLLFIMTRIAVFGFYPWLSDDVFGYLFYGNATLHGANLYTLTADNPLLTHLRDSAYDLMAFKQYQNIYPPVATMFMTLSAWIASWFHSSLFNSLLIWKILLFCCEGFGLWLLWKTLEEHEKSFFPILLYLAIPLTAIEGVGQAHNEILLLPILAGIIRITMNWKGKTHAIMIGVLCALAGLIKLYPFVLILPIMMQKMSIKESILTIVSCLTTILVASLPWFSGVMYGDMSAIAGYISVLSFYNGTYFNGVILYLFRFSFEALAIQEWWLLAPKAVSIVRLCSIIGMSVLARIKHYALPFSLFLVLCIAVCISPKVHTWYLIPIMFLGSMYSIKSLPILSGIMMLTYGMYAIDPAVESMFFEIILWMIMSITIFLEYKGALQIFNGGQSKVLT